MTSRSSRESTGSQGAAGGARLVSPNSQSQREKLSSSSSFEKKPTPLRPRSILKKKRSTPDSQARKSKKSTQEAAKPGRPREEESTAAKPAQAPVDTSAELFGTLPETVAQTAEANSTKPEEERRETEDKRRSSSLFSSEAADEKRRSSSLFSDIADARRISDSSAFSLPCAQPRRPPRSSDESTSRRSSSLLNTSNLEPIPDPSGPRRSSSLEPRRSSSSLFSMPMSEEDAAERLVEAVEPAMATSSALQPVEQSPATPAEDSQNVTVVAAKRKPDESPEVVKKQSRKRLRLQSSPLPPDAEFAVPVARAPIRTSSESKSSSSLAASASLFSSSEHPSVEELTEHEQESGNPGDRAAAAEEQPPSDEQDVIPSSVPATLTRTPRRGRGKKPSGGGSTRKTGESWI